MAENKKTYSEKLRDPRWQKKRLQILKRDKWKCVYCEDDKNTLHVHHRAYFKEPWDAPNEVLITLCEHCHWFIELLKSEGFWEHEFTEGVYKSPFEVSSTTDTYFVFLSDAVTVFVYNKTSRTIESSNYLDFDHIDYIRKIKKRRFKHG